MLPKVRSSLFCCVHIYIYIYIYKKNFFFSVLFLVLFLVLAFSFDSYNFLVLFWGVGVDGGG